MEPLGWQVVGLAIDGPTPVREFLGRLPNVSPDEIQAALGQLKE